MLLFFHTVMFVFMVLISSHNLHVDSRSKSHSVTELYLTGKPA